MIVRSVKDYSNKSKSFKQDKKVFYPLTFIFGSVGVFSKTCEYGLRPVFLWRILLQTAEKVGIKEIADGTGSPESFLAKILQDLSRRDIVQSTKGPHNININYTNS